MPNLRFIDKLSGQKFLLVGGTGSVGICLAQALIEFGGIIALSSPHESKIKVACTSLSSDYPEAKDRISGYICDLASPEVENNIEKMFQQVGEVDSIIYLAGDRLPMLPLEEVTLAKWQKCNQVRTIASILVIKVGLRYIRKDKSSSITLTSGSISEKPIAGGWAMLSFISAGINGLARQLAFDLAPIRVNVVAPGIVETELWQEIGESRSQTDSQNRESKILTEKVGRPEDLAEAYLYCLRDCNATGMIIHSNSGIFLQ